ncbi:nicotinate-nucleotide--dimethylbenzimidazole phosphoribosyltransferase [Escherichia sp. E4694]|uniref:nicotinate-nucleotide--dimethylbenzimidazole phosphoribosyltransferase n=1 Tax=Escherichia sp. E4694 TaxID=2044464 RepID=UPI0010800B4A|nr:nicotinate-nucleotide--dimethylbenzimidazole phosphoribosyltransferase [Escherichia sp. E4694]TGB74244.1 nicotinate-nucleotide--dimethylbenzimidazole phosphoribosyltransferase [Escherichia sp. E4694]
MQTLAELLNTIPAIDPAAMSRTQRYIDGLLKPVGSLGRLEALAVQLAGMPGLNGVPHVGQKAVLVMCADHGVWDEGVAISPKAVTAIQAENMTRGTTGVCVLAAQAGAKVHVIDVGIDTVEPIPGLINMRVARGSGNIASGPAMSPCQAEELLLNVIQYTRELARNGVTLFGVGELGMANTTPAAAIVSAITGRDPEEVVGIGANLPTDKLAHKVDVVRRAITLNQPNPLDGLDVLAKVGGFDLVGMAGVMLGAASCGLPVLLDGFLSYAAALAACRMCPAIKPYLIPSHLSAEKGACIALSHLGLEPYLNMEMRLGEGSGAALAMPIIEAACAIYSNMGELAASNIVLPGKTTSELNS